jgi:hypothetical protein
MSNAARRDAPPGNCASHHGSRGLAPRGRNTGDRFDRHRADWRRCDSPAAEPHFHSQTDNDPAHLQCAPAAGRPRETHGGGLGEHRATRHEHTTLRTVENEKSILRVASPNEERCTSFERIDRNALGASELASESVERRAAPSEPGPMPLFGIGHTFKAFHIEISHCRAHFLTGGTQGLCHQARAELSVDRRCSISCLGSGASFSAREGKTAHVRDARA